MSDLGWLLPPGAPAEAVPAVLAALPPDDPAVGIEVDVSADGAVVIARSDADREIDLDERHLVVLRHGLGLLGTPEAAALLARLPEPPAATHADGAIDGSHADAAHVTTTVILRLSPAVGAGITRRGLGERQRDGSTLLTVESADPDALFPWLLRLGPRVEVLAPRPLRLRMVDATLALSDRYREPPPGT